MTSTKTKNVSKGTNSSGLHHGFRADLIIKNPKGMEFTYALRRNSPRGKEEGKGYTLQGMKANYVLREIHEGSCSMHSGPRSVVAKALRSGYYWPTMDTDARNLIRECSGCQGIDIAKTFLEGPGKVKFLIVAMDYFTKWIEAKPVATITGAQVKKFVWDNIVCRFGLPGEIISDNENLFLLEEVSHVLWAHRTMIKSSNRETPFSLTYGMKAVIPVEISMPTLRTAEVDMIKNDEALGINLDLLEERREQAAIQEAKKAMKQAMRKTEASSDLSGKLGKGAYKLRDCNGNTLLQTWNVCNLKKCYVHEM
ncbi:reverse transcriptase domain-containing protein [Tanacetum coccineum]